MPFMLLFFTHYASFSFLKSPGLDISIKLSRGGISLPSSTSIDVDMALYIADSFKESLAEIEVL